MASVVAVFLASGALPTLRAQTTQPATLYKQALAHETTIRKQMDATADGVTPAPLLNRIRILVGTFRDISRLFPKSGYSDDALWQGAMLSADAFWQFGHSADRATALRMLHALDERFPKSALVARVPAEVERLENAKAAVSHASPAAPPARAPATSPAASGVPNAAAPRAVSRVSAPGSVLRSIRREVLPDALRVTLELDREEAFHDQRIDGPPRVFLDLQNTRADAALQDARLTYRDDVVRQIRVGRQLNARTRVVLDLENAGRYSVYSLYNPYRIVIDFERPRTPAPKPAVPASRRSSTVVARAPIPVPRPIPVPPTPPLRSFTPRVMTTTVAMADVHDNVSASLHEETVRAAEVAATTGTERPTPAPAAAPSAPSANVRGGFSLSRQLGLGIARIVIDPGHGGHDPGAQIKGLSEADLVLDVALRLEKLLKKQPGVEVVMTRRDDRYIPLEERTAIANRAGADLFLSIHANASENPTARGIETYFLNFAPNPEAEAIAARENAGAATTMGRLPDIVKAIALHNKIDESRDFASTVQTALYQRLRRTNKDVRSLGVKQAPFMVLIGATMPSILAEISFITNKQEGSLLKTDKYRQQIAEALFTGVLRYQQSLKRGVTVVSQTQ